MKSDYDCSSSCAGSLFQSNGCRLSYYSANRAYADQEEIRMTARVLCVRRLLPATEDSGTIPDRERRTYQRESA